MERSLTARFFIRVRDASVRLWIIFSLPAVLPRWLCLAFGNDGTYNFSMTYCIIADFRCVYRCWYSSVTFFLDVSHLSCNHQPPLSSSPLFTLNVSRSTIPSFCSFMKLNHVKTITTQSSARPLECGAHFKLQATAKTFNYWKLIEELSKLLNKLLF